MWRSSRDYSTKEPSETPWLYVLLLLYIKTRSRFPCSPMSDCFGWVAVLSAEHVYQVDVMYIVVKL